MPDQKELLFIDFDGTLCHDRFWRGVGPELYQRIQVFLFQDRPELVREWMVGQHTSEEINHLLAKEFAIPFEDLWRTFVDDCSTMRVEHELLERIQRLRQTYTTILVTGNMDSFTRFTRDSLKLDEYFDTIANSWDQKMIKDQEDGKVFMMYCDGAGRSIKDAVLIDDSEKVCSIFTRLGGTALRVATPTDTRAYLDMLLKG